MTEWSEPQMPENRRLIFARDMREALSAPEHAAALVTWDRDIEPLLVLHEYYWGNIRAIRYHLMPEVGPGPWVSMSAGGMHACCHHRFDSKCEKWVRMLPPHWTTNGDACPLDVLR